MVSLVRPPRVCRIGTSCRRSGQCQYIQPPDKSCVLVHYIIQYTSMSTRQKKNATLTCPHFVRWSKRRRVSASLVAYYIIFLKKTADNITQAQQVHRRGLRACIRIVAARAMLASSLVPRRLPLISRPVVCFFGTSRSTRSVVLNTFWLEVVPSCYAVYFSTKNKLLRGIPAISAEVMLEVPSSDFAALQHGLDRGA